jgi:hypothetical protein
MGTRIWGWPREGLFSIAFLWNVGKNAIQYVTYTKDAIICVALRFLSLSWSRLLQATADEIKEDTGHSEMWAAASVVVMSLSVRTVRNGTGSISWKLIWHWDRKAVHNSGHSKWSMGWFRVVVRCKLLRYITEEKEVGYKLWWRELKDKYKKYNVFIQVGNCFLWSANMLSFVWHTKVISNTKHSFIQVCRFFFKQSFR